MTIRSLFLVSLAILTCSGCGQPHRDDAESADPSPAPLFEGMGPHRRAVSTQSSECQRYFDQGLTWAFGFNHDEAIRSFKQAAKLDPACAMAWWGVALCNGPHINNPMMDAAHSAAAWSALQKALENVDSASPVEKDLIHALAKRYAAAPPTDRKDLDEAYAAAMREVFQRHPDDADVAVLFAEAMMDLRPWALWTKDGKPEPGTEELVAALEKAMQLSPDHPGALHLYIHAVEASPHPENAMAAADRLRNLVPASGHLTHMPSHIDIRTGRYKDAAEANVRAIAVDRAYRERSPRQGFYRIYMAHNHHFLAYASMMEGRSAAALQAAHALINAIPPEFLEHSAGLIDPVMMIELEVLMRFGRWDELLAQPRPKSSLPITTAFWRFARGIAHAAKGQIASAEKEQAGFRRARARVPKDAVMGNNKADDVLQVAEHMLQGEIEYRRGKIDAAAAALRRAIELEDALKYDEPPDWMQPVRHTLGAILLEAGRIEEAERVYREQLAKLPKDGWSLYGLAQCLKRRSAPEAQSAQKEFEQAWAQADVVIGASCLCVSKK